MRRLAAFLAVLLLPPLAGCTSPTSSFRGPAGELLRCLSQPGPGARETERPLFFLFCAESP